MKQKDKKEKNSAWIGLSRTFLATTFSILLTFGTASLIDRHKQAKEKRQIVLMVMYDMDHSLNQARKCDSLIQCFVETQTRILSDTSNNNLNLASLILLTSEINYTETIENIFSSSIESIHTIGNVFFVEKTSEFYQLRKKFKDNIEKYNGAVFDLISNINNYNDSVSDFFLFEQLHSFDSFHHFVLSSYMLADMEYLYRQCKQIMDVTDEELEVFHQMRQQIEKSSGEKENVWQSKIPKVEKSWQEVQKNVTAPK